MKALDLVSEVLIGKHISKENKEYIVTNKSIRRNHHADHQINRT